MPATTNAFALVQAPTSTKDKLPTNADLQKQLLPPKKTVKPYEEKAVASKLIDKDPVRRKNSR